jgi:purine-binding chemotaxis protein CheW
MNTATTKLRTETTAVPVAGGQYLIFSLAGEEYGVDILKVQEIRGWSPVTRVPRTPPYLQGVLNLRGTVVPVVDLRLRFGLPKQEYDASTVVVVLAIATADRGQRVLGVVVDGVSDVLAIPAEAVKPAPELGAAVRSEFLAGMATVEERVIVLLDTDRLLTADEVRSLEALPLTAGE